MVKRKTADSRLHRAIKKIAEWCRLNRHRPMQEQAQILAQKLRGHYRYYGVIGNLRCLQRFHYAVVCLWRKWLSRRTRRGYLPWPKYLGLLRAFALPWPVSPSAAKPRPDEPYARNGHVRICGRDGGNPHPDPALCFPPAEPSHLA